MKKKTQRISLIAAMSENRSIGIDNRLPWHLPADLKRFKELTMGHPMILGRRTFDSIGSVPLPGRPTIVVTRQPEYNPPGVQVARTLEEALDKAEGDEVFIGGGEEIFRLALDHADRIYLTVIYKEFPGDTFFPEFDRTVWRLTGQEDHEATAKTPAFSFQVYDR